MNHRHIFHFLQNRELNELYVSIAIRNFAVSMINIFIPIYLLNLGYSLATVMVFYAIMAGAHALSVFPAAWIASKHGFKHSIFFSAPFLLVFYIMLYTLTSYGWPLPVIAVFYGMSNAFFWMGYHVDIAKFSDKKHRGKQLSVMEICTQILHVASPAIGGFVLAFSGFHTLFAVVCGLMMVSAIPLFLSKDIHEPAGVKFRDVFRRRKIRDALGFIAHGFEGGVAQVVWPIVIYFTILSSFTTLGFVHSVSLFSSLVVVWLIGKFSDINRRLVLRLSALLNILVWTARALISTTFQVFIVDGFYGISLAGRHISFNALSYDKANKDNLIVYTMFREVMINSSRSLLFVILIFLTAKYATFIIGGVSSLLLMLF